MRNTLSFSFTLLALALGCGKKDSSTDVPVDPKYRTTMKAAPSEDDEVASLQGSWQVTSIVAAGEKVPDDKVKKLDLTYVFNGDKVTIKANTGTFKVDPKHTPKRIDLYIPGRGRTRGVYSQEGNTLRLCVDVDEFAKKYPESIESKADPKTDVLTLQKQ